MSQLTSKNDTFIFSSELFCHNWWSTQLLMQEMKRQRQRNVITIHPWTPVTIFLKIHPVGLWWELFLEDYFRVPSQYFALSCNTLCSLTIHVEYPCNTVAWPHNTFALSHTYMSRYLAILLRYLVICFAFSHNTFAWPKQYCCVTLRYFCVAMQYISVMLLCITSQ